LMKINFQPFCRNGIGVNETKKSRCTDWNDWLARKIYFSSKMLFHRKIIFFCRE
jgi:hypothetical protein